MPTPSSYPTAPIPSAPPGGLIGPADPELYLSGPSVLATVSLQEAIGAGPTIRALTSSEQYLHLQAISSLSEAATATSYLDAPMQSHGETSGTLYTFEKWIRVRFDPPFNTVSRFRFWTPNLDPAVLAAAGRSVQWGSTDSYRPPMNSPSTIAVNPILTADPVSPNCGGEQHLEGTQTRYSDWIVLQACAQLGVADPGPALGYDSSNEPVQIAFAFAWSET